MFHWRCSIALAAGILFIAQIGAAEPQAPNDPHVNRPRKILFDTDPGGDDVFALLWLQSLAKQGHAEIVAVTTVAGNVDGKTTFTNACKILALGGFGTIEVGRCAAPASQAPDAAHFFGIDGMGNLSGTLPEAKRRLSEARSAADIIVEKLSAAPGQVTLVAVGPLTNLAAAERKCPGILAKARELVVMGGAVRHRGNVTAQAEFNIHFDPEAAETVFASRADVVVLPLDVTSRITFMEQHAELIRQAAPHHAVTRLVRALAQFLTKTSMTYRDTEGVAGFHVHDAATLAYLFYPETLSLQRAKVQVETKGQWTRGQTVVDQRHDAKAEPNAWVAVQVDATNLLAVLVEDIRWLCEVQ